MPNDKELKSVKHIHQIIRYVRDELGIDLKKTGSNAYSAYCPFHRDSNPSLRVYVKDDVVRFHCFGACDFDEDIYGLIQSKIGCSFRGAQRRLAEYLGVKVDADTTSLPRGVPEPLHEEEKQETEVEVVQPKELDQEVIDALEDAASFYNKYLTGKPEKLEKQYKYLLRRGLDADIIRQFQIGYAQQYKPGEESCGKKLIFANLDRFKENHHRFNAYCRAGLFRHIDDKFKKGHQYYHQFVDYFEMNAFGGYGDYFAGRITFPIRDIRGRACGMVGRRLDNREPRWVFPSTKESDLNPTGWLYGIDKAARYIHRYKTVILVEGIFDYFAVYKLFKDTNRPIVVSTLGSKLTSEAAMILSDLGVKNYIVAYDWDKAGKKAILKIAKNTGGTVSYLGGMKEGEDPAVKLKDAVNAIDGFSLKHLMEGTAKAQESTEKPLGFHFITSGPLDKHSLIFQPEATVPVSEASNQKSADYIYRVDDFIPLLSYNHPNRAALNTKLTQLLHMLNTRITPEETDKTFTIPYNFIADKHYEMLGPGLILWLYILINQQQKKRRVKMSDTELADQLQTSRQTISKHKGQLVKSGYLEVLINRHKRTQRLSAKFFPKGLAAK